MKKKYIYCILTTCTTDEGQLITDKSSDSIKVYSSKLDALEKFRWLHNWNKDRATYVSELYEIKENKEWSNEIVAWFCYSYNEVGIHYREELIKLYINYPI